MSVPPEPQPLTIGMCVEAAFRLFDVLPFEVRRDISRLIYLYLHDQEGYRERRATLFHPRPTPPEEPTP